jgi:hypothetical protein
LWVASSRHDDAWSERAARIGALTIQLTIAATEAAILTVNARITAKLAVQMINLAVAAPLILGVKHTRTTSFRTCPPLFAAFLFSTHLIGEWSRRFLSRRTGASRTFINHRDGVWAALVTTRVIGHTITPTTTSWERGRTSASHRDNPLRHTVTAFVRLWVEGQIATASLLVLLVLTLWLLLLLLSLLLFLVSLLSFLLFSFTTATFGTLTSSALVLFTFLLLLLWIGALVAVSLARFQTVEFLLQRVNPVVKLVVIVLVVSRRSWRTVLSELHNFSAIAALVRVTIIRHLIVTAVLTIVLLFLVLTLVVVVIVVIVVIVIVVVVSWSRRVIWAGRMSSWSWMRCYYADHKHSENEAHKSKPPHLFW